MNRLDEILENAKISRWANRFPRAPHQLNRLHESDAELLEIPGDADNLLAVSIDTVAEEIAEGLYQDPYTMGWTTVMAVLSDLAAVGASPLGLVVSLALENDWGRERFEALARGMEEACRRLGIFLLGGDTNQAKMPIFSGCALGMVRRDRVLTRMGCRPGHQLFASGRAGMGNGLACVRLAGLPRELFPEQWYRPVARIEEAVLVREYASCCMDSSDGFFSTLDQLARLNGTGFEIDCDWERIIEHRVLAFCEKAGVPPWLMAAGIHGEFELVFALPREKVDDFLRRAAAREWEPVRLGRVTEHQELALNSPSGKRSVIDMAPLRNLLDDGGVEPKELVHRFLDWGREMGVE